MFIVNMNKTLLIQYMHSCIGDHAKLLFVSQICVCCSHVRRSSAGSCEGFGGGGGETESGERGEDRNISQSPGQRVFKTPERWREPIQTEEKRGAERPLTSLSILAGMWHCGWRTSAGNIRALLSRKTQTTLFEARLFEALLKTKLIQDRQTSNYHRCGRTDKGVSAFSQVLQSAFSFMLLIMFSYFPGFPSINQ